MKKRNLLAMSVVMTILLSSAVASAEVIKTAYAVNDTQEFAVSSDLVNMLWYLDGAEAQSGTSGWSHTWSQSEEGYHNVILTGEYSANGTAFTQEWEALVINPDQTVAGLSPAGKEMNFSINCDAKINGTWYFDHICVETNETRAYQFIWSRFFNFSEIGYHNIIFMGRNDFGLTSIEWKDFYVGNIMLVSNNVTDINIKTDSIIVNAGETFYVSTFANDIIGDFIPADLTSEERMTLHYKVTSDFFDLATMSGTITAERDCNGTIYPAPLTATGKNGTFLISLFDPAAESADHRKANVSIEVGQVVVTQAWDINGDFVVNIIDLLILRQHYGEITIEPYPRYDIDKNGVVNIIDLIILRQRYGEQIPTV